MAVKPFSKEELNFFKFSSIVLDEFPKALRQIFVTMWDNKIAVQPGYQIWDDSTAVRNMLLKSEGGKTVIPVNQSIDEWDCTALFKATIFAKTFASASGGLPTKTLNYLYLKTKKPAPGHFHPLVSSATGNHDETLALAIDQLRLLRNALCHSAKPRIVKSDFDHYVQLVKDALTAAIVSTTSIDVIGGMTEDDFPTEKVNTLREQLLEEVKAINQFLEKDIKDKICDIPDQLTELNKGMCEILELMKTRSERQTVIDNDDESKTSDSLPKSQLPSLVPQFTGRESERENISSLITAKSTRLVNIWGSPGFGKTATAIAVAHHLQSLAHPVYYSTFRGKTSKDELFSKLLSIFNSFSKLNAVNANLIPADKLFNIFREIPCPFFLVLDNLDDLLASKPNEGPNSSVKDEIVNIIQEIVMNCPNVSLLTTTRESLEFLRLNLEGFEAVRIRSLDQVSSNSLIRKFLSSVSEDILSEISKVSGNVPLAIKLVCSLISEDTETPEHVLDDIKTSEDLLEILDNPDYPNELRLKKLIDSSFDRLSKNEKDAFISLSVFLGTDFNSNAGVAVIGGNKTVAKRSLRTLSRKSLIDHDPEYKLFLLHPLLQFFAVEKVENVFKEIEHSSRFRFYKYYLLLFENLNEQHLTAGGSLKAYMTFVQEMGNIWRSLLQSISHEELHEQIFDVLIKAEWSILFWLDLFCSDKFDHPYELAIEVAKKLKNDKAHCKLLVSQALLTTLKLGSSGKFPLIPESTRKQITLMSDGTKSKLLCCEGIRVISSRNKEEGAKLLEKGCSGLEKNYDQQILKCLSLQLLSVYYNHSKNLDRSKYFDEMALDQCNEIGDSRLYVIGECPTTTEIEAEELMSGKALTNQPLILQIIFFMGVCAKNILSDEMKQNLSNTVCEIQREIELQGSDELYKLLCFVDLVLFILGNNQKTHLDETIQSIETELKNKESNGNRGNKIKSTLKKTVPWMMLQEIRLAQCYYYKGFHHSTTGEPDLAIESLQHSLDISLRLNGEDDTTAKCFFRIGEAQNRIGDNTLALESFKRALAITLKLHGEQHETTADTYFEIARTQSMMGNYTSALESHQYALAITLKLHGEDHETTCRSYYEIGITQVMMGNYTLGLESHQRALAITLKLHGEEHETTCRSYYVIGITQVMMGNYTSALESHQRALDIRLKLHGEEHERTAESYSMIGFVQTIIGDHTVALQSHQRALAINSKFHNEQQNITADSYVRLGTMQACIGDNTSALVSYQRSLDINLKLHGEHHVTTNRSYYFIGTMQYHMKDYTSALKSHQHALDIRFKLHGEQYIFTAVIYFNLGQTQFDMEDYTSALESYQRCLDIILKMHGEQHETTANSYLKIGMTQYKMTKYKEALESTFQALKISLSLNGKLHAMTAACYRIIGITWGSIGKKRLALRNVLDAWDIRSKIFGNSNGKTLESYIDVLRCSQ